MKPFKINALSYGGDEVRITLFRQLPQSSVKWLLCFKYACTILPLVSILFRRHPQINVGVIVVGCGAGMGKATGRHKVEHLTAAFCKNAKPGRHTDGRGLYLVVDPTGAKRWMQRATILGRRRDIGLGPYPAVGLAEARARAQANREMIEKGRDPIEERKAAADEAKALRNRWTFQDAVEDYLSANLEGFRNAKHRQQWRNTLDQYARPAFGEKYVDEVSTEDVLRALRPIWNTRTETASRLRGRIERVLQSAKVHGHRTGENPARWRDHLEEILTKPSKIAKSDNQPAISLDDAAAWFSDLRQRDGMGARALEFAALTGARSGEVRGAEWSEIDLVRGVWTVPKSRMKNEREHRVTLSPSALALLNALPRIDGNSLVFPAARGGQLSDMTLSAVMRRMHEAKVENDLEVAKAAGVPFDENLAGWRDRQSRRPAVPHGLRSTFRQWAAEQGYPRDMAEIAIAHFIGSEVERAYQRSDMLERRRAMMTAWADFLSGTQASNIVHLAVGT